MRAASYAAVLLNRLSEEDDRVHACTIVARKRMAYASVLAESFLLLHRGSRFTILVVDGEPGEIDDVGRVRVLTPVEAGVKRDDLQRLATVHDTDGLTMAMVPRLLEHLLDEREG